MQSIDELKRDFSTIEGVEFIEMDEGMPVITVKNDAAKAKVSLQGAQLIDYRLGEESLIWLSEEARLAPGKSIRGGIPICWPWFGAHPSEPDFPAHGYARTVPWRLLKADRINHNRTVLELALVQSPYTRELFPHPISVRLTLSIGATLEIALKTTNCGDEAFTLTEALHTYFPVGDINKVRVHGLDGCEYLDKVTGFDRKQQAGAVKIKGEVDRIYLDTDGRCEIHDPVLKRRIRLTAKNSRSTVVWNPGSKKAKQMGDLGDNGNRQMLCVESANAADNSVTLSPGQMHTLALRLERRAY